MRILTDREYAIENLLTIEDKNRRTVPMTLWPIQRDIVRNIIQPGFRGVFVKPAQVGASAGVIAAVILDTLFVPGTNSVMIAYEDFITQRLLTKGQNNYDSLASLGIPGFPEMHHRGAHEKTFPEIRSSFYVGSARSYVVGRGETIHNLILDEYAFWPEPEKALGAMQRVPEWGRIIILSTPNGEANSFCDMYKMAKENQEIGTAVYTHHFYPWYDHPEYHISADSPIALEVDRISPLKNLDSDELKLMEFKGLTEDQIRWRRRKIAEMEQMRRDGLTRRLFHQEYPEDDETCFLATGEMVYDHELLNRLARGCYEAPDRFDGTAVWHKPEPNTPYILSIDPGVGKDSKTAITVWHFVWDGDTEKAVHDATLAGMLVPEITAYKAIELGRYYNHALITFEANGHGVALVPFFKKYSRIYWRKDIVSGKVSMEPGWITSGKTKPYMVSELSRLLQNMDTHDIRLIGEMRNLRWEGTGKIEVVGEDDIHDSAAIAMACRPNKPSRRGYIGRYGPGDEF